MPEAANSESLKESFEEGMSAFVLYSDSTASNVQCFHLELQMQDPDTGEAIFPAVCSHSAPVVNAAQPLYVSAALDGAIPNFAVGYMDPHGVYRFAFVEISGKDRTLILREF